MAGGISSGGGIGSNDPTRDLNISVDPTIHQKEVEKTAETEGGEIVQSTGTAPLREHENLVIEEDKKLEEVSTTRRASSKPAIPAPNAEITAHGTIAHLTESMGILADEFDSANGQAVMNEFANRMSQSSVIETYTGVATQVSELGDQLDADLAAGNISQESYNYSRDLIGNITAKIQELINTLDKDMKKQETADTLMQRTRVLAEANVRVSAMLEAADERYSAAITRGIGQIVAGATNWLFGIGSIASGGTEIAAAGHDKAAAGFDAEATMAEARSNIDQSTMDVSKKMHDNFADLRNKLIEELQKLQQQQRDIESKVIGGI